MWICMHKNIYKTLFPAISPQGDPELAVLMKLQQHSVKMASVFQADGSPVLSGSRVAVCTSCGSYAWGGVQNLAKPCQAPTTALKRQRNRAAEGKFPGWAPQYAGWRIGSLTEATGHDLACLVARRAPSLVSQEGQTDELLGEAGGGVVWGRSELLARFGLTQESVEAWAIRAERLKAAVSREAEPAEGGSESDFEEQF